MDGIALDSSSMISVDLDDRLYAEREMDFSSLKSTLFPEDRTENIFDQVAVYQQPDFATHIKYDHARSSGPAYSPASEFGPQCYQNRDEALYQESLSRLKARAHLPVSERYSGYEDGLIAKIKGVVKRAFYVISRFSAERGLAAYDVHLAGQARTLAFANYSAKPAQNFKVQMLPRTPIMQRLGIRDYKAEHRKLNFSSTWHKNGLPSYQFIEDGERVTLHNTVASSNDRTNDGICMMRHVDSDHTGESVFYSGRPDSESKAKEQISFIFRNEMSKSEAARKGITYNQETGEYELTYIVNNLMSVQGSDRTGLTWLAGFDERESILREMEVLANLGTLVIDGKKVNIRPLYFSQCFNFLNDMGTSSTQQKINKIGYEGLLMLAKAAPRSPLLDSAIRHLENLDDLLPEEEFFYRDLICKLLGLPEVIHCKSSTDRTIIAGAIAMATQQWMNCGRPIPCDNPHEILSDPVFKELFISNALSGHQVTRHSRSAEGIVKGARQFSQLLGYEWGKNGYVKNAIALRMVPDRYKREGKRPLNIRVTLFFLKIAKNYFNSESASSRIAYLERAYKEEEFDHDSFVIKDQRLIKPKKMKMHYEEDDVHPRDCIPKTSIIKSIKGSITNAAADVALCVFGFFDAIVST